MFVPKLNGSSLGDELLLDPFFFFWFFGVMEEGELLEDEWEVFTACCCCEWFKFLFFSFGILLGFIWYLLLLLVWLNFTLPSSVAFTACVHLKMETGLYSAVLVAIVVVECH